jgi:hypothetical protein
VTDALGDLARRLTTTPGRDPHRAYLAAEIGRHLARSRSDAPAPAAAGEPPPGQPIGTWMDEECAWSSDHD